MFSKLAQFALLALLAPLVSALTLHVPNPINSQGSVTITWDTAPGDPDSFSLELNNDSFNNAFAIANNVDPSLGSLTITIPAVPPGGGYTLSAVNIGDINQAYSTTASFSIGAATSSSVTTSASTSSGASVSSVSSSSASTRSVTTSAISTSAPATTATTTATAPSSTANNAANPSATSLSGAPSLKFNAGLVVSALAGVAGAAFMAL